MGVFLKESKQVPNTETVPVIHDGKRTGVVVVRPSNRLLKRAESYSKRVYREAIEEGAPVTAHLARLAEEKGVWDQERQRRTQELQRQLLADEERLDQEDLPRDEGREIARRMAENRAEWRRLMDGFWGLQCSTAEHRAIDAQFDYLVAACAQDERTHRPIYRDVQDYTSRGDPLSRSTANTLMCLIYDLPLEHPEVLYLRQHEQERVA